MWVGLLLNSTTPIQLAVTTASVENLLRYQVLQYLSWILGAPPTVLTQKFPSTAVGVIRPGLA